MTARLGMGRGYNATTFLNGEIWVIGGDVELTGGRRLAVGTVQICDLRSAMVRRGPELPVALPMPLAVHLSGRIYVAGSPKDRYTDPGMLFSIGAGESVWRREPDGPAGMSALAGTPHEGRFYILVPHRSLAIFDPAKSAWTEVDPPKKPRSSQVASYQGEIWVMGGIGMRDNRETQIFNPQTGRWRPGPDLPRPLSWGAAANVNGRLMLAGGDGGRCYSNRTFYLHDKWQR